MQVWPGRHGHVSCYSRDPLGLAFQADGGGRVSFAFPQVLVQVVKIPVEARLGRLLETLPRHPGTPGRTSLISAEPSPYRGGSGFILLLPTVSSPGLF